MQDEHIPSEDQLVETQRRRIDDLIGLLISLGFEAEELLEATATA